MTSTNYYMIVTMKNIILLFVLFNGLTMQAQIWADSGATWHYNFQNFNLEGYSELSYQGDTLIQGIEVKKILKRLNYVDFVLEEELLDVFYGYEYMYSDSDRVYQFIDNEFKILYDFSVQIGDTITLFLSDVDMDAFACNIGHAIVTETGVENVNGEELRFYVIETIEEFDTHFNGKIIENIGAIDHYMFSEPYCIITDVIRGPLRCYQDDDFELYMNPEYVGYCDSLADIDTSIPSISLTNFDLSISPNPAKNTIHLKLNNNTQAKRIRVYSIKGKVIMDIEFISTLDISQLQNGIYLLEVKDNDGFKDVKRFVVE